VQHERHALERTEPLQNHEQRDPDRVSHERRMLGTFISDLVGHLTLIRGTLIRGVVERDGMHGGLPTAMPQTIEAYARRDRRQPGADVSDLVQGNFVDLQPALLNSLLGLVPIAKDALGDAAQARPVPFEDRG
jgi:hypothetical protein